MLSTFSLLYSHPWKGSFVHKIFGRNIEIFGDHGSSSCCDLLLDPVKVVAGLVNLPVQQRGHPLGDLLVLGGAPLEDGAGPVDM